MAAAVLSPNGRREQDVFHSVFPWTNLPTPTPEATPNIGTISSPVAAFGGLNSSFNVPDDAVVFSRAWSTVTRHLTLQPGIETTPRPPPDEHVSQALLTILRTEATQKDLVSWYSNEINVHFRHYVRPMLVARDAPIPISSARNLLQRSVDVLQAAQQNRYLDCIARLTWAVPDGESKALIRAFYRQIQSSLHSMVMHSLPRQRLQKTMASVMYQHMVSSLEESSNPEKCLHAAQCHCRLDLQGLPLQGLNNVGLGGLFGERAFAHAVHKFLSGPAIERRCFQVDWNGHSSVVSKLRSWVESKLSIIIEQALSAITGNRNLKLTSADVRQFVCIAVSNLGRLRTVALFDYVKAWPASTGAILDIREYIYSDAQGDKAHVCQSFSDQVQGRLLHAGASTSEILSIYVNVIHAFRTLDSRGVLLEKVAVPIFHYLRSREDTVGIIAASFLADVDQDNNVVSTDTDKVCPDITMEVINSSLGESKHNKMLNWDDMRWMPDPIDAGPDYKSSKSEDVIAYILGLFEQEEFIKEATTVLAQHLLHGTDAEYVKETRLVELFKSRLDPSKLQAAEVMLKDVRDSVTLGKRINPYASYDAPATTTTTAQPAPTPREIQAAIPAEGITLAALYRNFDGRMKRPQFLAAVRLVATKRNDLFFAKRTRIPPDPPSSSARQQGKSENQGAGTNFKAQILSSFFWPQLRANEFDLPPALASFQAGFENRFHALGGQRKLHFRPALARVSLRLELEDRTVEELDVPGWRASVVDVFASDLPDGGDSVGFTAEQIVERLGMEEELVQDALSFWVGKNVLYQREGGVYAVLERLDMDVGAPQPSMMQQESISAVVSQDAMLREGAGMFETFIANMLRNQGPKQIGGMMGITSLLKMVLPTFTYGDDEVAWLLGEMESRGEVLRNGDVWTIAQ